MQHILLLFYFACKIINSSISYYEHIRVVFQSNFFVFMSDDIRILSKEHGVQNRVQDRICNVCF